MDTPSSTVDDMVKKIDSMDTTKPRTFKTHAAPPTLPFYDKIKYLVIARNPEECVVSMRHFISKRSPEFNKYWNVSPMNFPDVESFYNAFGKDLMKRSFAFVSEWWKLRDKENVLMLHYSDMVKDHEHSIKKISDFLDFGPYTDEEWQTILELTSFSWMKQHERKFEGRTIWAVPILIRGGMIRQGSSGLARKEGISEELANDFNGKAIISKVNVDANQELAAQFDVRSIPALFYFKNRKLVSRQNGLQSKTALTNQLNTLINN